MNDQKLFRIWDIRSIYTFMLYNNGEVVEIKEYNNIYDVKITYKVTSFVNGIDVSF